MTGDGIADLVTGCFEGGLYVIAGKKGGGYKAPAALLDKAGKILRIGQYWDDEARKWTGVKSSKYASVLGISGTATDAVVFSTTSSEAVSSVSSPRSRYPPPPSISRSAPFRPPADRSRSPAWLEV